MEDALAGFYGCYKTGRFCFGLQTGKGSTMTKEKKNPIVAGLLNMLIPGSGYLYVEADRSRFIRIFVGGALLIAAMVGLSIAIQNIRGYSLPQGLCTGILLLVVWVPLFLAGQKTARLHNSMMDDTAQYNTRRTTSQGSNDEKLGKIQKMRDEGLISEQEYEKKKKGLSL